MACHVNDGQSVAGTDHVDEEWLMGLKKQHTTFRLDDQSAVKTVTDSWRDFANNESGQSYAVDVPGENCRAAGMNWELLVDDDANSMLQCPYSDCCRNNIPLLGCLGLIYSRFPMTF